jgi:hypothetical protein
MQSEKQIEPADAAADLATYLARVELLYGDVQRWLSDLEPQDRITRSSVDLTELWTGPYQAPGLTVERPGSFVVQLVPRGRYTLGASGWVDVRSALGSEMLVWVGDGGAGDGYRFGSGFGGGEVDGEPVYPGVAEGWAWADQSHLDLVHLDRGVFARVLETLS